MTKILCSSLLLFLSLFGVAQDSDPILIHGKIITLKEQGDTAEAIAIEGQNIVAVGSNKKHLERLRGKGR